MNYQHIAKSELCSADRRCAMCPSNIFFKLRACQINQIRGAAWIKLRKHNANDHKITAAQVRNKEGLERLIQSDSVFRDLPKLRTSPDYYDKLKKSVFAMIRQLGTPTWFFTFSCADLHWPELISALCQTVDGKVVTEEEAMHLSVADRNRLIAVDPVTCSRYYKHRFEAFRKIVMEKCPDMMGAVKDFYHRDEFQQRGSAHTHGLAWVKGAPVYGVNSDEEVFEFIDKHISCSSDNMPEGTIFMQEHRHRRYCMKKGQCICRFDFPKPPMCCTRILASVTEAEVGKQEFEMHSNNWDKVKKHLKVMEKEGIEHNNNFEEFLSYLTLTEGEYLMAVRTYISKPTIFLKRGPKDIRINGYNKVGFPMWHANMDMQFVLDPFAAAMYVVSYMMKSQRGVSNLINSVIKECVKDRRSITERVKRLGNAFLNANEVCVQEAVYLILGLKMTDSSRTDVFVPTCMSKDCRRVLKNQAELEQLQDNDTNIFKSNIVDNYMQRHHYKIFAEGDYWMANGDICVADFATKYDRVKVNGEWVYRLRNKERILRYVHYNKETQTEDYCREQYMLFHPWQTLDNMENHIGYNSHAERYEKCFRIIEANRRKFYRIDDEEWHGIEEAVRNEIQKQKNRKDWEYDGTLHEDEGPPIRYDISGDLGGNRTGRINESEQVANVIPFDKLCEQVRLLNDKQRAFFNHVVHWVRTNDATQMFAFLSGGAGVGKSMLVNTAVQFLERHYGADLDANFSLPHVMLLAPTGKAAFNIDGSTVHGGLSIKINGSKQWYPLSSEKLAEKHAGTANSGRCTGSLASVRPIALAASGVWCRRIRVGNTLLSSLIYRALRGCQCERTTGPGAMMPI